MTKRQIIIVAVALAILLIGKLSMDFMATPPKKQKPEDKVRIITVFTTEVELTEIPIEVTTTGSLEAKQRMELFSEVQGLMLPDNGRFKPGIRFNKGQTLISLRSDDAMARVVAQRSSFERLLTTVMADIRIDYPDAYQTWSDYLNNIKVDKSLASLPEVADLQLKSYLTGRNVFAEFHNVRNAEIGLSRYYIAAPFSGVLISANVDPGTIVRPGQLLGVFVKPGVYELQASTSTEVIARLSKGQKVSLYQDDEDKQVYEGIVSRVNASIDPQTQMSSFFVEVSSDDLKDGQFMKLAVQGESIENAFEINRSAIKDSRYVFVVEDETLRKVNVNLLHSTKNTAIIRGVQNGQQVLTKLPPTAFDGMKVKVFSEAIAE